MSEPRFPPLFSGQDAQGADPFSLAVDLAKAGCDAGLVIYDLAPDRLRAAMVFAPEVALSEAAVMLPLCGVGLQNAIGALGPPEVGVHLGWDGTVYVNGGRCGALRMAASGTPEVEPDWLIVELTLSLWPESDDMGLTPDQTALYAEGCAEIDAVALLEAWVRHTLVGINTWLDSGTAQLHREWQGLAHGLEGEVTFAGQTGTFIGLDDRLGLLLKAGDKTMLVPLTETLTRPL
ncbi:biotin/lipoate--protein ligase family protein [Sulfitobacter sp.]|uniref:biotin/lipoate--protein ligase family protein n=1 Tax=Sulfitobacter sp. TaxID=1903071 RepID=UPI00329A291E